MNDNQPPDELAAKREKLAIMRIKVGGKVVREVPLDVAFEVKDPIAVMKARDQIAKRRKR